MFGDPETNSKNLPVEKLEQHINVIGGYAFKSSDFKKSGIPILRIGNINSGIFKPINLMFWEESSNLERYIVKPNDLVISLTGTAGKEDYGNICILSNDYDKYYLNQRNAKLDIFGKLNNLYLANVLKFDTIKRKLTGINRGIRQGNISNRDILNLEIPIPPIELQNQFADFVKHIDKLKFTLKQTLEKLENCYHSLMQEYFE